MIGSFRDQDVGGAVVKRMFTGYRAGEVLDRATVLAIRGANRAALINQGKIVVFPLGNAVVMADVTVTEQAPEIEHAQRHVVSRGFGKYDVIAGTILNAEPLDKDSALALAGTAPEAEPAPKAKGKRKAKH
jgi:hypothetical protein